MAQHAWRSLPSGSQLSERRCFKLGAIDAVHKLGTFTKPASPLTPKVASYSTTISASSALLSQICGTSSSRPITPKVTVSLLAVWIP